MKKNNPSLGTKVFKKLLLISMIQDLKLESIAPNVAPKRKIKNRLIKTHLD